MHLFLIYILKKFLNYIPFFLYIELSPSNFMETSLLRYNIHYNSAFWSIEARHVNTWSLIETYLDTPELFCILVFCKCAFECFVNVHWSIDQGGASRDVNNSIISFCLK